MQSMDAAHTQRGGACGRLNSESAWTWGTVAQSAKVLPKVSTQEGDNSNQNRHPTTFCRTDCRAVVVLLPVLVRMVVPNFSRSGPCHEQGARCDGQEPHFDNTAARSGCGGAVRAPETAQSKGPSRFAQAG